MDLITITLIKQNLKKSFSLDKVHSVTFKGVEKTDELIISCKGLRGLNAMERESVPMKLSENSEMVDLFTSKVASELKMKERYEFEMKIDFEIKLLYLKIKYLSLENELLMLNDTIEL